MTRVHFEQAAWALRDALRNDAEVTLDAERIETALRLDGATPTDFELRLLVDGVSKNLFYEIPLVQKFPALVELIDDEFSVCFDWRAHDRQERERWQLDLPFGGSQ